MRTHTKDNFKAILLTSFLILVTRIVDVFPWWSFVVPVMALGIVITLRKWSVSFFSIGFLSGFIIWAGLNLYYDTTASSSILGRWGIGIRLLVLLISGIIGGLLTGLALYTGKSIAYNKTAELTL